MKQLRYRLLTIVLVVVAVTILSCKQKIEQESPLLLENSNVSENFSLPTGPVADNSRCHVCHINYEDEKLAVVHARANVSCEKCHGSSNAHCSDEDNITPPDIMYPAEKINDFCKTCHPNSKLGGDKKYCTDCHGEHRLGYRTRKWDKATGKLLKDDKVRMITEPPPQQQ